MMPIRVRRAGPREQSMRPTSLRSRWNRAFAMLTAFVVISGVAGLVGTSVVVDIFRNSAVRGEQEATTSARLRTDVVAQSVLLAGAITPGWGAQLTAAQTVDDAFEHAIAIEDTPRAEALLRSSLSEWRSIVNAAGSAVAPASLVVRGAAVAAHAPKALELLDQASSVNRNAVSDALSRAGRINRGVTALLVALDLLAIALAMRLSRRLSGQVLRPLSGMRDSANQLASGELDHRVTVDRSDELGDLAVSFNAMADAIAGSQRSLTLEANTDSLSGLANRAAFGARLESTLARPDRRASIGAVLFVDLDDFKDVNDTLGHAAGDELLRVVSARLREAVRPNDLVARLGGDEFALLLDGLPVASDARVVADRIVLALAEPVRLGQSWAHVGASVGLAMRRPDSTPVGLMRQADVAMYAAKAKGKSRVENYDADLDEAALARSVLKTDLAGAATRGELVLDYQPVVDLETGLLVGLEALVRWQHPTRGLLPPSEFIEVAEQTGDIVSIGSFVLRTAASQLLGWQRRYGLPHLWMSVNVSVRELEDVGFVANLERELHESRLDPRHLVIEVTETVLADPSGGVAPALTALRLAGVRVALDDFGTGYSSIGYLRQLPVDILKIDRSFVACAKGDQQGNALLEAIVTLAEHLGLAVIPEGIEDLEQMVRLREMGCRIGQGFLLSRPVSAAAIDLLLSEALPLANIGLTDLVRPM
jgi:diguanylate cyclase (GGDEF)-like protein